MEQQRKVKAITFMDVNQIAVRKYEDWRQA
jgi:hypothetical protein